MKGIVFTTFNDMVVEQYGLAVWDALLTTTKPASEGCYTAAGTYPYEELQALIVELARLQNIPVPTLIEAYGHYMFAVLAQRYPIFLQGHETLFSFLKSIHGVIHVEVKKLYTDADLPRIDCEDMGPNKLAVLYRSPRKLCFLATGLIQGAADHFKVVASVQQPICMHQNADHCRLEVMLQA